MALTHFADDDTIAELERQARRIAELDALVAELRERLASRCDDDGLTDDEMDAAFGGNK